LGETLLTIKAVIFDLDGTLVNFNLDIKSIRAETIRFLKGQGYPSSLFSMKETIYKMLGNLEVYMKTKGEEASKFSKIKKSVLSIADRYELEATQTTHLIQGVLETVKALRKMRLKTALFTIRGPAATDHFIRQYDVARFFDAVITREDTVAVKPDPAHLKAVLKILRIQPSEAVVVGDSVLDMQCARKLDMIAVGVSTGIASPQELAQAQASYLISSIMEIPRLIQQLNSRKKN